MTKFDNGFGGTDEQLMTEHFEYLVGGKVNATRLLELWKLSRAEGPQLGIMRGRGRTKKDMFAKRAKDEGFTQEQLDCFYEL